MSVFQWFTFSKTRPFPGLFLEKRRKGGEKSRKRGQVKQKIHFGRGFEMDFSRNNVLHFNCRTLTCADTNRRSRIEQRSIPHPRLWNRKDIRNRLF